MQLDDHAVSDICGFLGIAVVQLVSYLKTKLDVKNALVNQSKAQSVEITQVRQAAEENGKTLAEIKGSI